MYNMKERINISIDSEVAKTMRTEAIKKYGSLRSFSQLIEDTYTHKNHVNDPAAVNAAPSIKAIKEARAAYIKRTNMANVQCSDGEYGTCGFRPDRNVLCKTCGALFTTYPSLSLCCPACRSSELSYIEDDEYSKRLNDERRSIPPLTEEEKRIALDERLAELRGNPAEREKPSSP